MEARDSPRLKRTQRLDSIRLDAKDRTYFTEEGYLVDHPALTRTGIFEYKNPDGSPRRELRLPEHVFAPESLKSYRGKPIIITHEAGVVDKDNVDREQIGTILSDGYRDGENVRAEIIIHNTDAMKDSGLRELSLGYNLDLVEEPGVWEGQPYDAIQTNIVINHLALVAEARAGERARLNIDSRENPEERGGGKKMEENRKDLTPEQLEEAIALYREKHSATDGDGTEPEIPVETDGGEDEVPAGEDVETDGEDEPPAASDDGNSVEEKVAMVRDRRDRRDAEGEPDDLKSAKSVIARQDADIDTLLACIEAMLSEKAAKQDGEDTENADCGGSSKKSDSAEGEAKAMNADSADTMIRQRLSICRVGDLLHLDGLENRSIMGGKKAIIAKVLPTLRLDGQSKAYIDAAYDLAVSEAKKRKDVDYQLRQMRGGAASRRSDGRNESMAVAARQRMLEREGGNQ